jgi:hypothetical protein
MLLYFKVANSRSFAKEAVFSMVASNDYSNDYSHQINTPNIKVLKTSLLYGANASGKSNLLKAIADSVLMIRNSHKYSKNETEDSVYALKFYPNKNESVNINKPTSYTFGIFINNKIFEYSFSNTAERIVNESLIEKSNNKNEIVHFIRVYYKNNNQYFYPQLSQEFKNKFDVLIPFTKKENLFLSISAQLSEEPQYKIETADLIWNFFKNKLHYIINHSAPQKNEIKSVLNFIRTNAPQKHQFLEVLKQADFSIVDIKFNSFIDENGKRDFKIKTIHKGINGKQESVLVEYDLFDEESVGILQFIYWWGHLVLASAQNRTLIIDEFGNSMHPMLSEFLLHLFQSKHGQLIFSTHDVKLMNSKYIKPEQIWIMKKDSLSNSSIFPLSDFDIENDKMVDNVYLDGLFKGVPNIIY